MSERGEIRNREFAQQIKDFRGLKFERGITPTDIDGFLDFDNETFIIFEIKHKRPDIQDGQRKALERLCDACADGGKKTILLIAVHETSGDIGVADLPVAQYRYLKKWRTPKQKLTLRQAIDDFRGFVN